MSTDTLQLRNWALDVARKWNSESYSMFILHGNIFDGFPVTVKGQIEHVSLKAFLTCRLFAERDYLLFFDISDGLTFATKDMQTNFFKWLEYYDETEKTDYHIRGVPRNFVQLAPILRRFFRKVQDEDKGGSGITLVIDFPEKIVPASEESSLSNEERTALVTLLKWASSKEVRDSDINIFLITESVADLNRDLLNNPYVAQTLIELPDEQERTTFLQSGWFRNLCDNKKIESVSDLDIEQLAARTSGLNIVRIQSLLAEAVRNGERITHQHIATSKKRLIEEYCQGLVKFKEPDKNLSMDSVATHKAAKKKLEELVWLIKNGKRDVLEKGILLPGRVGVGKSFLVDCFASMCGLPVMELGNFRSKWVGDTESQQAKILMTIKALGPVIVVVDEADAAFGNREANGDSGVSSRAFVAFAAHIGDSRLRGRELWIAMTSRPDLLSIDMKRQGRFGLCIPLFPAQNPDEVIELFSVMAKRYGVELPNKITEYIRNDLGKKPLTGSDVESIVVRAKEIAVLASRDHDVRLEDFCQAIDSFIDPLDANLLLVQEYAAVLACSDKRYLPARYSSVNRVVIEKKFAEVKAHVLR